jgi:hypothetical protein
MMRWLWVLCAAALLAACDGGPAPAPSASVPRNFSTALEQAASGQAVVLPAVPPAAAPLPEVTAADAAEQLLNFAEKNFPQHFPSTQPTLSFDGYLFRFYPETGVYLGVKDGKVYLLGGVFGPAVVEVGPLLAFITPTPAPGTAPPLQALALCAQAGVSHDVAATASTRVGQNAAATVAACSGSISSPVWTQLSGPAVVLAADKTQTISFEPPQAATYTFEVSFRDGSNVARTRNVSVVAVAGAGAEPATRLTLRASHSVRAGGKVSLRAWPTLASGDALASITWEVVDGPQVALDTKNPQIAFFTAPDVGRDTLLRLRATLRTVKGESDTDEVWVLVERYVQAAASNGNALWAGDHVSRVYPYRPNGRYAGVLLRCIYDASQIGGGAGVNLCATSQLPFLGQETRGATPTVEQIMDRVLVSHDWLGRNFEEFLRTQDAQGDIRRMLGSVTAVVLGTQVRPSFYWAATGAIYLDGDNFWRTPEERDTVNEAPDYRSDFDSALAYSDLWRYVRGNQTLFTYFDPAQRVSRSAEDVRDDAAWLMFHELGHALDYLPPHEYSALIPRLSAWANLYPRVASADLASDALARSFPLTSAAMRGLAQVKYRGATADAAQRAYTPEQVAAFFTLDVASDDYAYTAGTEDAALTLEETLMSRRLGALRDVAFADKATATSTSSSLIVRWGQRGRIGQDSLKPRAALMLQRLTPWIDVSEVEQLPAPIPLRPGASWRDNLAQPAAAAQARALDAPDAAAAAQQWRKERQRMQHQLHIGGPRRLPPAPAP